jgi:hypothetical protein
MMLHHAGGQSRSVSLKIIRVSSPDAVKTPFIFPILYVRAEPIKLSREDEILMELAALAA